jgi:hypothetical protein
MTPPIYKRGKLDPSEYGNVVSMAEHASHWRFAMGVTCLVVFAIGAVAYWVRVNAQTGDRGQLHGGAGHAAERRCGASP